MEIIFNYSTRELDLNGSLYSVENENLVDTIELVLPVELLHFSIDWEIADGRGNKIKTIPLTSSFNGEPIFYNLGIDITEHYPKIKYQIVATHAATERRWISNLGFLYFKKGIGISEITAL